MRSIARLGDVAREPRHLLRDVGPIREERHFLREARRVEGDAARQLRDPLREPGAVVLDGLGREPGHARGERLDGAEPPGEIAGERLPLSRAHRDQGVQRGGEAAARGLAGRVEVELTLVEPHDALRGEHIGERRRAGQPEPRLDLGEGARVRLGERDVYARREAPGPARAADADVHAAAREPILDVLRNLDLERGELARNANLDLAELVVDGPDLDVELLAAGRSAPRAEPGHAADHRCTARASLTSPTSRRP